MTPPPNTVALDPVELPVLHTPRGHKPRSSSLAHNQSPGHRRNKSSADHYYEDVDPRFASQSPSQDTIRQTQHTQSSTTVPQALMPGISNVDESQHQAVHPTIETIDPTSSYESFQDGQMSPAASEGSNMTSISQRGVNPNWRPDGAQRPGQANLGVPSRRPVQPQQQQRDVLLNSNPDFELPGGARGARNPAIPRPQQGQAF